MKSLLSALLGGTLLVALNLGTSPLGGGMSAEAAEFTPDGEVVWMEGEIAPGDVERAQEAFATGSSNSASKPIS